MENVTKDYIINPDANRALNLVRKCRGLGLYILGAFFGEYLYKYFSFSKDLLDEYAICLYYSGRHEESHKIYQRLLNSSRLSKSNIIHYVFNDHFNYKALQGKQSFYNHTLVKELYNRRKNSKSMITFTITTCKRFDLFCRTINSFLNCCKDIHLIDKWICIDDNSGIVQRRKMQIFYPFFKFVFKFPDEKGHAQSMNMITDLVETPYLCHMEDDWEFFTVDNYITKSLEILSTRDEIKQCLFNQNYAEVAADISILGGHVMMTESLRSFYLHDRRPDFEKIYGRGPNCAYWPSFSLRPSLLKSEIYKHLGGFKPEASHFEMEYAERYSDKGFKSAFFTGINCIHIGRLTSERNTTKKNAYNLNNEPQFFKKQQDTIDSKKLKKMSEEVKTFLVNLDHREDRKIQAFRNFKNWRFLKVERFAAVNGKKLKSNINLSRLFDGNDYNMRKGIVGCALSHIKIMIDFLYSERKYCLVLEDDIKIPMKNFEERLYKTIKVLPEDFGLLYLGYHIRKEFINSETFNHNKDCKVIPWNVDDCLRESMGGTFAYLLSKRGAEEILNFIDSTGMTNAIDTMQQKAGRVTKLFKCEPMLVISECVQGENKVDSDIQFDYDSLTISQDDIFDLEIEEHLSRHKEVHFTSKIETAMSYANDKTSGHLSIYDSREEDGMFELMLKLEENNYHYYLIDDIAICWFPDSLKDDVYNCRGISRLKWQKNDKIFFNIDRCISYTEPEKNSQP